MCIHYILTLCDPLSGNRRPTMQRNRSGSLSGIARQERSWFKFRGSLNASHEHLLCT